METFWFVAVLLMLAIYVVLDGFDFGIGIIYLFAARTDAEEETVTGYEHICKPAEAVTYDKSAKVPRHSLLESPYSIN